jgi:hypothetical protein
VLAFLRFVAVVAISLALGGSLPGYCQTVLPRSDDAGSNRQVCGPDGIYRGEYRNLGREYRVVLPDGVAATAPTTPCVPAGFDISLTHPTSGELGAEYVSSRLWVRGAMQTREPLQYIIGHWPEAARQAAEAVGATDLKIDLPEEVLLSSLPAIHLKVTRTEPNSGKLIYEWIIANNPHIDIVYSVGMASPADQYEKNQQLFKAVVKGFSYLPSENGDNPEATGMQ